MQWQWLQKLFRKKNNHQGIVGLSFLPQGMSIAVSDYTENNALKLIHCEFIETKKADDRSAILKQWFLAHKLGNYDCHLVLDIDDYQRVNIETPAVPVNEIALAIRWKINELIYFPIDEAVIDYYPVPAFSEGQATLEVIACPQSIVKPLVEQCIQAGLCLKVIDIQETALRNLAVLLPNNPLGIAVLYLQKSFGIILIQKNGVIYVARKIAIGYEKLNLDDQPISSDYYDVALEIDSQAAMVQDNLALEIQRSLDYVESYYDMSTITELAVIPWAVATQNLVDKLNNFYGITAYLMELSAIMDCDLKLDYVTQTLCVPVIGTTLRDIP
jgi:MSHA biogenesis protein MshI